MKAQRLWIVAIALVAGLALGSVAHAVTITFEDAPAFAGDPGFNADGSFAGTDQGVFRFSGGDPLFLEDTFVDPSKAYAGDHSLANGFIGWESLVFLESHTLPFASVSAQFAFETTLLPATLHLAGYDAGDNLLHEVSYQFNDVGWHPISLSYSAGMSYVKFYDEAGNPFNIDDVNIALVPEPGTLALLAMGAAGLAVRARKRRRA